MSKVFTTRMAARAHRYDQAAQRMVSSVWHRNCEASPRFRTLQAEVEFSSQDTQTAIQVVSMAVAAQAPVYDEQQASGWDASKPHHTSALPSALPWQGTASADALLQLCQHQHQAMAPHLASWDLLHSAIHSAHSDVRGLCSHLHSTHSSTEGFMAQAERLAQQRTCRMCFNAFRALHGARLITPLCVYADQQLSTEAQAAQRFNEQHLLTEEEEQQIAAGAMGAGGTLSPGFCAALRRAAVLRAQCKATLQTSTSEHAMVALEHNAKLEEHGLGEVFAWASDAAAAVDESSAESSPLWPGLLLAAALLRPRPSYGQAVLNALFACRSNALLRRFLAASRGGGGSEAAQVLAATAGDPVRHTAATLAWLLQSLLEEADAITALTAEPSEVQGAALAAPPAVREGVSALAAPLAGSLAARCSRNIKTAAAAGSLAQVFQCCDVVRLYLGKLAPLLAPPAAAGKGGARGACKLHRALQDVLRSGPHLILQAAAKANGSFAEGVLSLPSTLLSPPPLTALVGGLRALLTAVQGALVPLPVVDADMLLGGIVGEQHVHAKLQSAEPPGQWGQLLPEERHLLPGLPPPPQAPDENNSAVATAGAVAAAVCSSLVFALGTLKAQGQAALEADTLGMYVAARSIRKQLQPLTSPLPQIHAELLSHLSGQRRWISAPSS